MNWSEASLTPHVGHFTNSWISLKEMADFLREDVRELKTGREGVATEISAIAREGHF